MATGLERVLSAVSWWIWASGDAHREKYVTAGEGIQDFDVGGSDWRRYNYTRLSPVAPAGCARSTSQSHRAALGSIGSFRSQPGSQ